MNEITDIANQMSDAATGTPFWVEIIGYLAMFLVAVSIMMTNMKLLRILNMAGAICFTLYGFLIGSWPIIILNSFLTLVNLFYLLKKQEAKA